MCMHVFVCMCVCVHACVCVCVYICDVYMCMYTGLIRSEVELKEAISILLPESGYVLCPGIPAELYKNCLSCTVS